MWSARQSKLKTFQPQNRKKIDENLKTFSPSFAIHRPRNFLLQVQLQSERRLSRDYGGVGYEWMLRNRNRILAIFQTQKQMYDSLI